jgi:hypothetical protein
VSPWFKAALLVNVLMCAVFVYTSYTQWEIFGGNNVAGTRIITSSWNPFSIAVLFHVYENGMFSTVETVFVYSNTPFIVFWLSTMVNLAFIVLIIKSKEEN